MDRYPQRKDGPKTHHVSKLIIFERILQGGKFKSGWMVTSPCDFYQPRQQRRKARSGKPAILIHISANARADACGCPCGCGRSLAKDHCGSEIPPKNGRGCISGVWEIQSNRKQPALRMPNGGVWHIVYWGGRGFSAVSSPSLDDAFVLRSSLLPTCGFHASFQTWPCHALTPHQVSPPRLGPATF